ncbi:MAG: hypothetical protein QOD92_634 [Acidimicrobiaceae bacterium]|jgi:hypothetical protein
MIARRAIQEAQLGGEAAESGDVPTQEAGA